MKKLSILCIAVLTAGVTIAGVYDPDYRGDENSVHVVFEKPPFIPPGAPAPLALTVFDIGPSIYPLWPELPEADYDGWSTHIFMPNVIDELPMKKIRIQMEFDLPVAGADLFVEAFGGGPILGHTFFTGGSDPFIPALEHFVDIEMFPNPDYETFYITNTYDPVNSPRLIEIDTVSIPEPATLGLLGLISGGIYFARRFFIA